MDEAFQQLQARLRELHGPALKKTQRKALKRVGEMFHDAIVERTPVKSQTGSRGGELADGELKASIKARVSVASDEATLAGRPDRVVIGPTGHDVKLIAHDVEYGHGNAAAKGFIRAAFDTTRDAAIAAYTESVEADLKKVAP